MAQRDKRLQEPSPRRCGRVPFHTDSELSYETRELIVRATTGPDAAMATLIAEAPPSLRVTWQQAPYTQEQLMGEAQRLMAAQHRLTSAGPVNGGTGLRVTTTDIELLNASDPRRALGARFPVEVDHQGSATPARPESGFTCCSQGQRQFALRERGKSGRA